MGDYRDDPEFRQWEERIRRELLPMIEQSVMSISIVPTGEVDVKFAVELGLSIMLGKPIIVCVSPGVRVPEKLVLVSDEIVEIDMAADRAIGQAALMAAISRVRERQQ